MSAAAIVGRIVRVAQVGGGGHILLLGSQATCSEIKALSSSGGEMP